MNNYIIFTDHLNIHGIQQIKTGPPGKIVGLEILADMRAQITAAARDEYLHLYNFVDIETYNPIEFYRATAKN